jgi:hypothetical protein
MAMKALLTKIYNSALGLCRCAEQNPPEAARQDGEGVEKAPAELHDIIPVD